MFVQCYNLFRILKNEKSQSIDFFLILKHLMREYIIGTPRIRMKNRKINQKATIDFQCFFIFITQLQDLQ